MSQPNSHFATTQWTLVWKAAKEDSQDGRPALAEIINRYWHPLYSFARKRGLNSQDAEDATQEFLGHVVSGKLLESANPAQGRFRAYLLTAWKSFLIDDYRKKNAARRGGAVQTVSLDIGSGEQKWQELQSKEPDPDRLFMLSWAESLLEDTRKRLRQEYYGRGKAQLIEILLPRLTKSIDAAEQEQLGAQLGLSKGAVKVALHRLRQRFGQALRETVAETVEHPADVDAELADLLELLADKQ